MMNEVEKEIRDQKEQLFKES